jgi:hypothetical protein
VKPCEINFFQLFLGYTAVYQQQQTAHVSQQNSFIVGMGSLSCGKLSADWLWEFSAIFAEDKKVYNYISTPFLGNYGLFYL